MIFLEIKQGHRREFCLGFALSIIAWILYFLLSLDFTLLVIPLHYMGLYYLRISLIESRWYVKAGIIILLVSICLDFFVYQPIHLTRYSLLYFISINLIHVSIYFLNEKSKYIQITLIMIAFLLWMVSLWELTFFPGLIAIEISTLIRLSKKKKIILLLVMSIIFIILVMA